MSVLRDHPRAPTEGERWTEAALGEVRRRRYRPRAWITFLRSSLERSRTTRSCRPELARQAAKWGLTGGAAWCAACFAARRQGERRLPLVAGLAWWLTVWRMLDWHLGMAEDEDGRPLTRLSPADAITHTRFWLVPALPSAARGDLAAPAVIALAGLTDWADGRAARRLRPSRLGRDLDSTADLAFLTTAAISAHGAGRLPRYGLVALLGRHGLGLGHSLGLAFGRARRPTVRPRGWGAVLRVSGLLVCTAGRPRIGGPLLVSGSLVPPAHTFARFAGRRNRQGPKCGTSRRPRPG